MRILWATNSAAPYRLPVWERLASDHDLQVMLLEDDANLRNGSLNRGPDWAYDDTGSSFAVFARRTWGISRGEARYHILPPSGRSSSLQGIDTVLLGGWESPAYWQLLAQAKLRRIRTVGFYESTRLSQAHGSGPIAAARKWFFSSLDAVVVPGAAAEDAILRMGVSPRRIFVGFNAVDVQAIHDGAWASRDGTGAEDPPGHRYLSIAQLIDRKNLRALIEAFASVKGPHDSLRLVGTGPLEDELRQQADGLSIQFSGHVPYSELPALLARHHTLALPSTYEVWGLVVNEALAAGLHAVVSDRCGVADAIRGMPGTYVTSPDRDALAIALERSRDAWVGPIASPEILKFGPREFSATFEAAFRGS